MFFFRTLLCGLALTLTFVLPTANADEDLASPQQLLSLSWPVTTDTPVFRDQDVKNLLAKVEKTMDIFSEVQEDIIDRFSKCDGDIAALHAKGQKLETISVPYSVASGQIKLVKERARNLRKFLTTAKPESLDLIGPKLLLFVRQFHFIRPLIAELAKNSKKTYFSKLRQQYESWREWGLSWNEFDTLKEKENVLTWQLLIGDLSYMFSESQTLLQFFAPTDRVKIKRDYLDSLAVLDKAVHGKNFKNETARRAYILEATKNFTERFSGLYESLAWQTEQVLGADREYDLLVYTMGTNELLKRYVNELEKK